MSIDYKRIYVQVTELYNELFFELGKCYLNNSSSEKVLKDFVMHLDFVLFPNSIFTDKNIPIMESKYEEVN